MALVKTPDKLARSVYRVAEVDDFRGARSAPTPLCKQSESSKVQDDAGLVDTAFARSFSVTSRTGCTQSRKAIWAMILAD